MARLLRYHIYTSILAIIASSYFIVLMLPYIDNIKEHPFISAINNIFLAYGINNNNIYKDLIGNKILPQASGNKPDIYLFIGESATGDHFIVNGYKRNTSPYTSSEKSVISIPNAKSCRMSTNFSVSCMLTGLDPDKLLQSASQTSLLSFFAASGYDVYIISSGALDIYEMLAPEVANLKRIYLSKNSLKSDFLVNDDEFILEKLHEVLAHRTENKPIMVLFNVMGSHYPYENRVPVKYYDMVRSQKIYHSNPVDYETSKGQLCFAHKGKSYDDVIDWYDATLLYTDHLLSQLLNMIKDSNNLFIYTSDHGDAFGENSGPCLHGYNSPMVWSVPFLIAPSYKFRLENETRYSQINRNVKKLINNNIPWQAHLTTFSTLLDCAGVANGFYQSDLSLCSENFDSNRKALMCGKFINDNESKSFCQ